MASKEQYDGLVRGLQLLAGVCDGAISDDGMGFNGTDSRFGRSLAEQAFHQTLTPGQQRPAIKLIQKYRGQLAGMGFEDLPTMADYGEPYGAEVVTAKEKKAEVMVTGRDGFLSVSFNYNIVPNKDRLKSVLAWNMRRFDQTSRSWIVNPKVAGQVKMAFPDAQWDAAALALAEGPEDPEPEPEPPVKAPVPRMTVRIVKSSVVMRTPETTREQFMAWLADQKEVPGRKFKDTADMGKYWAAPTSSIPWIVEHWADREDIDLGQDVLDAHQSMIKRASMSRAADGELAEDLPIPAGLEPYGYQKAGFNFLKEADFRAILADDMGLGKTIQAIMGIMYLKDRGPVLVSCPASVKLNWKREMELWIPGIRVQVLNGRTPSHALDVAAFDVFIINHDILAVKDKDKSTKKKVVLKGWIDQFLAMSWSLVVFDEGHKVGNTSGAIRGRAAKLISRESERVIFLTGTPLPNRPKELWPLLNMVDPHAWPDFWSFAHQYCDPVNNGFGWDFNGASNLEDLHEKIKPWFLRRMKTDPKIGLELPGKRRTDIVLELSNRKAYDAEVARFAKLAREGNAQPHDLLSHLGKLKQLAAKAKLAQGIDWIKDFVESGQKLIVFAWHTEIIDAVMAALEKANIGAVKLTGSTSQTKRQEVVDQFQTDPDTMVFVGNIQAAGEGITLTAASDVAFLEYGWKPGEHSQAEDRANRIGQDQKVTVWYLNAHDTIDGTLFGIIDGKRQVIDVVTDGETQGHQSDVLVMTEEVQEWTDRDFVDVMARKLFK